MTIFGQLGMTLELIRVAFILALIFMGTTFLLPWAFWLSFRLTAIDFLPFAKAVLAFLSFFEDIFAWTFLSFLCFIAALWRSRAILIDLTKSCLFFLYRFICWS